MGGVISDTQVNPDTAGDPPRSPGANAYSGCVLSLTRWKSGRLQAYTSSTRRSRSPPPVPLLKPHSVCNLSEATPTRSCQIRTAQQPQQHQALGKKHLEQASLDHLLREQLIRLEEEVQHLKSEKQALVQQLGWLQASNRELKSEMRKLRDLVAEVPQLRREAQKCGNMRSIIELLKRELEVKEIAMQQQQKTLQELECHQRQGVEHRFQIALLETELKGANSAIDLLRKELQSRGDCSCANPQQQTQKTLAAHLHASFWEQGLVVKGK
ncbi:hypothetical protein Emed_005385 [Eimeria media]